MSEFEDAQEVQVTILENGPVIIRGKFEAIGIDGRALNLTPADRERGIAFCRCGRTQNKPFCDGSHAK